MFRSIGNLLARFARHSKLYFLLSVFAVLVQSAGTLAGTVLPSRLVDALADKAYAGAVRVALALCLVTFAVAALSQILAYLTGRISRRFNHQLQMDLAHHAASLPYAMFEDFSVREKYKFAERCASENSAEKILSYLAETLSAVISLAGLLWICSHIVWWLWIVLIVGIAINTACESYRKNFNFHYGQEQDPIDMRMCYSRDRLTWKSFAKEVRLQASYYKKQAERRALEELAFE